MSLVLLLVLELFLRLFAPQSLSGRSIRGEHFSVEDSVLGIRYVPGAVWRFRHPEYRVEYAINDEGFRDSKPRPARKPPGVTRILLLGDSFTFAQGVNYEDAWPVIAERVLDRRYPGQVDLVKAGIQGTDTRSQLILLRRLARHFDVDVVVVSFLINDLYTNVPYEERPDTEAADSGGSWAQVRTTVFVDRREDRTFHLLALARRLVTSVDAAYVKLYLAAPDRGGFLRLPLGTNAERQLRVTEALFDRMSAYCDSIGVPLVVQSIPQQFQVLYPEAAAGDPSIDVHFYDRHFADYAAKRGFAWVAMAKEFQAGHAAGAELFHRLDGHLTAAGNRVVAEAFLRHLVPRFLAGGRLPDQVTQSSTE